MILEKIKLTENFKWATLPYFPLKKALKLAAYVGNSGHLKQFQLHILNIWQSSPFKRLCKLNSFQDHNGYGLLELNSLYNKCRY